MIGAVSAAFFFRWIASVGAVVSGARFRYNHINGRRCIAYNLLDCKHQARKQAMCARTQRVRALLDKLRVSDMEEPILLMQEIIRKVDPLARKYRVQRAYLCGSYARGEAHDHSNVDFLIVGSDDFDPLWILELNQELSVALGKKVGAYELGELDDDTERRDRLTRERRLVYEEFCSNAAATPSHKETIPLVFLNLVKRVVPSGEAAHEMETERAEQPKGFTEDGDRRPQYTSEERIARLCRNAESLLSTFESRGVTKENFQDSPINEWIAIEPLKSMSKEAEQLPDEIKATCPDVPWGRLAQMAVQLEGDDSTVEWDSISDLVFDSVPVLVRELRNLQ